MPENEFVQKIRSNCTRVVSEAGELSAVTEEFVEGVAKRLSEYRALLNQQAQEAEGDRESAINYSNKRFNEGRRDAYRYAEDQLGMFFRDLLDSR